eukprot:scaffold40146_cov43-Phaeocystis_antarctica.AAC.3
MRTATIDNTACNRMLCPPCPPCRWAHRRTWAAAGCRSEGRGGRRRGGCRRGCSRRPTRS